MCPAALCLPPPVLLPQWLITPTASAPPLPSSARIPPVPPHPPFSIPHPLPPQDTQATTPSPTSITQATLSLLARLTKAHTNAQAALHKGVHKMLLSLPSACLVPSFSRVEGHVAAVLRHMAEDHATLAAWMEGEIRSFFTTRSKWVGWGGAC